MAVKQEKKQGMLFSLFSLIIFLIIIDEIIAIIWVIGWFIGIRLGGIAWISWFISIFLSLLIICTTIWMHKQELAKNLATPNELRKTISELLMKLFLGAPLIITGVFLLVFTLLSIILKSVPKSTVLTNWNTAIYLVPGLGGSLIGWIIIEKGPESLYYFLHDCATKLLKR